MIDFVMEEQLAFGFPGLGQEVTEICQELGLPQVPDASRLDVDPNEFKEAIKFQNLKNLQKEMEGKWKLEAISRSDMRKAQEYVEWSVEECQTAFRLQTAN